MPSYGKVKQNTIEKMYEKTVNIFWSLLLEVFVCETLP